MTSLVVAVSYALPVSSYVSYEQEWFALLLANAAAILGITSISIAFIKWKSFPFPADAIRSIGASNTWKLKVINITLVQMYCKKLFKWQKQRIILEKFYRMLPNRRWIALLQTLMSFPRNTAWDNAVLFTRIVNTTLHFSPHSVGGKPNLYYSYATITGWKHFDKNRRAKRLT